MKRDPSWSREARGNLDELDERVRSRLQALDEPVSRSEWRDVVRRSRAPWLRGRGVRAAGFATAAVACLAAAWVVLAGALVHGGSSTGASVPSRLALRLSDGRRVVLYSRVQKTLFVDETRDRVTGGTGSANLVSEGTWRTLTRTGPFRIDRASLHRDRGNAGPLPGDAALFSFNLYTTAGLNDAAGSAVLTCHFLAARQAVCSGSLALADGSRLAASGELDPGTSSLFLDATTVGHGPLS